MAKKASMILGVVFVLVGILGFIPNPIVGHGAFFHTNMVHNVAHLLLGIFMIAMANSAPNTAMIVSGVIYLLLAILGFATKSPLLGIVEINGNDNWLHIVLAVVLIGVGLSLKKETTMASGSPTM